MNEESDTSPPKLRAGESLLVSFAFWFTFLVASFLYAILTLSPRYMDVAELKKQSHLLNFSIDQKQNEIAHFNQVATAIQNDSDFVARLTKKEFAFADQGSIEIQVEKNLNFDARIPVSSPTVSEISPQWYEETLIQFSEPGSLRTRSYYLLATLFMIAFLFLNESFFSGKFGRSILSWSCAFFKRYQITPVNLD